MTDGSPPTRPRSTRSDGFAGRYTLPILRVRELGDELRRPRGPGRARTRITSATAVVDEPRDTGERHRRALAEARRARELGEHAAPDDAQPRRAVPDRDRRRCRRPRCPRSSSVRVPSMISDGAAGARPSTTVGATVPFTGSIASVSKIAAPLRSRLIVADRDRLRFRGAPASATASGRRSGANWSPTWMSQFQPYRWGSSRSCAATRRSRARRRSPRRRGSR